MVLLKFADMKLYYFEILSSLAGGACFIDRPLAAARFRGLQSFAGP